MPPVGFEFTYTTPSGKHTSPYYLPGMGTRLEDGESVVFPDLPSHVKQASSVVSVTCRRRGFGVLIQPGTIDSISSDSFQEKIVVGKGEHYDLNNFRACWGSIGTLRMEHTSDERKRSIIATKIRSLLKYLGKD